jgi:hypothetical protein
MAQPASYTIREFCEAHRIAPATYFILQREGTGPRVYRVGRKVLISLEAAADWRAQREAESASRPRIVRPAGEGVTR